MRAGELVAIAGEEMLLEHALLWVDDPVFGHAAPRVELPLLLAIEHRARGGEDLDHEVGHTVDAARRDDPPPRGEDEDEIGLDDVVGRELEIGRRVEDLAETGQLHLHVELELDAARERLVVGPRRRVHDVRSIDQLVAAPVRGEALVLGVGQLRATGHARLPLRPAVDRGWLTRFLRF